VAAGLVAALGSGAARADDPPPGPGPAGAGTGGTAPAAAPAPGSSFELGARYFDEAVAYVGRGAAIGKTQDFTVRLDAKWDLDDNHFEGEEAVWYAAPDRMRTEMTALARTTTKILAGDHAWVVTDRGSVNRIHATPGAEGTLKQMKEDLARVKDLTDFVTLQGLKGPGVSFEWLGAVAGTGSYEGKWQKVLRRSPDDRRITFWLAYDTDAQGQAHATWPGVVRVEGDAKAGLHTEDWILRDWDRPASPARPFRYPFKIEAWQRNPDEQAAKTDPPKQFLVAFVEDIQRNSGAAGGIVDAKFLPPAPPPEGVTPPK
jgi:hypothetical protein